MTYPPKKPNGDFIAPRGSGSPFEVSCEILAGHDVIGEAREKIRKAIGARAIGLRDTSLLILSARELKGNATTPDWSIEQHRMRTARHNYGQEAEKHHLEPSANLSLARLHVTVNPRKLEGSGRVIVATVAGPDGTQPLVNTLRRTARTVIQPTGIYQAPNLSNLTEAYIPLVGLTQGPEPDLSDILLPSGLITVGEPRILRPPKSAT